MGLNMSISSRYVIAWTLNRNASTTFRVPVYESYDRGGGTYMTIKKSGSKMP
jgi:hypothetical protein